MSYSVAAATKPKVAIIGGSGFEKYLEEGRTIRVGTPYGPSPPITLGEIHGVSVAFLPRHGRGHEVPPHRVNFRANVWSLKELGVERIMATNAVGAINLAYRPGDIVVPSDLIDFTKLRKQTFYDERPVTHIDITEPYCPEVRGAILKAAGSAGVSFWPEGVLVVTEGPRYETPAEIRMFRALGCDIVGMTGAPEAYLARELEMCYAAICFVSNMAAGAQSRLSALEVAAVAKKVLPEVARVIEEALIRLPDKRACPCSRALEEARLGG